MTDGKLVDATDPKYYEFAEDVPFSSPSAAAAVIFGGNKRGPVVWRYATGVGTYADWQQEKLKQDGMGPTTD